jgi:hypothetical protein
MWVRCVARPPLFYVHAEDVGSILQCAANATGQACYACSEFIWVTHEDERMRGAYVPEATARGLYALHADCPAPAPLGDEPVAVKLLVHDIEYEFAGARCHWIVADVLLSLRAQHPDLQPMLDDHMPAYVCGAQSGEPIHPRRQLRQLQELSWVVCPRVYSSRLARCTLRGFPFSWTRDDVRSFLAERDLQYADIQFDTFNKGGLTGRVFLTLLREEDFGLFRERLDGAAAGARYLEVLPEVAREDVAPDMRSLCSDVRLLPW